MTSFLIALQIIVCVLLITLVLLQPSKGGSFFTASNQGVFGSSGGTTFLFRATMWCAVFLAFSCLFLSWFKINEQSQSVIDVTAPTVQTAPAPAAPGGTAPVQSAPAAPAAPTAPTPSK